MKDIYTSKAEYLEDVEEQQEKEKNEKMYQHGKANLHPPIYCMETKMVYPSYTDAAIATGCSRWGVRRCCEGVQEETRGFHFFYEEEDISGKLLSMMKFPYMEL